jgi:hypothetical protein
MFSSSSYSCTRPPRGRGTSHVWGQWTGSGVVSVTHQTSRFTPARAALRVECVIERAFFHLPETSSRTHTRQHTQGVRTATLTTVDPSLSARYPPLQVGVCTHAHASGAHRVRWHRCACGPSLRPSTPPHRILHSVHARRGQQRRERPAGRCAAPIITMIVAIEHRLCLVVAVAVGRRDASIPASHTVPPSRVQRP